MQWICERWFLARIYVANDFDDWTTISIDKMMNQCWNTDKYLLYIFIVMYRMHDQNEIDSISSWIWLNWLENVRWTNIRKWFDVISGSSSVNLNMCVLWCFDLAIKKTVLWNVYWEKLRINCIDFCFSSFFFTRFNHKIDHIPDFISFFSF